MYKRQEEETISKLEKKIAEFKSVTYALEHEHTPGKMREDLLGDMDMKIYEKVPTQFHCNCSKERVEKAVISVGKKEIQNMIDAVSYTHLDVYKRQIQHRGMKEDYLQ